MAISLTSPEINARKPSVRMTLVRVLQTFWTWRRRHAERVELVHLLERADDRMLSDVGLSRAKLANEAGKPFWQE